MSRALLAVMLTFFSCSSASAQIIGMIDGVTPAPDFGFTIEHAFRVARVRITAKEAVQVDLLQEGKVCGYSYSAKVVEAFKGGAAPFKFFSTGSIDSRALDRDYFVISFRQPEPAGQTMDAVRDLADDYAFFYRLRCLTSQKDYVPADYQTLWAFDPEARKRFGGEWLTAATRKDAFFCGYTAGHANQDLLRIEKVAEDGRRRFVINWSDVERMVRTGLVKPDTLITCGYK
ncbi:MAG TPA: hypothetical protein VFV07_03015 [Rhizomicrobium sp.]|nr:hypothetical protein [Rhizomicrobium sp.]